MRIVVALSGGVDSAVAAARRKCEGAEVVGAHDSTGAAAADAGAPAAQRSCCGVHDPRAVLSERAPGLLVEGDVVDLEGRPIGRHGGAAGFTVGQRKGIGIAAATAVYVSRVETATNRVTVAPREALLRSTVPVEE